MPAKPNVAPAAISSTKPRKEHKILFQKYFKSAGTRTYAAQVKEATNGNHYIVLTEGQRDRESDELRKRTVCIFSEDFEALANLLRETFAFLKANPLPEEFRRRRAEYWKSRRDRKQAPSSPSGFNSRAPVALASKSTSKRDGQ